ncbi:MAG: hypothetical protein GAK43_01585 [Stenotrophomonas maltophilia]|nr:MAG: hypothetical protein GAK43_01585 [Stenotrophomonas maltophilia]
MPNTHHTLWVSVETWNAEHPTRLLVGRMRLRDYRGLLNGNAPSMVRLDDCQRSERPTGPIEDLFLQSTHILSVFPLEHYQR